VSIVERIVTVYNDKGSKQAVKDLKSLEKKFVDSGKKIGQAFAVATVAVGAFAVKIGVDAVKGAMEDQKQQAALATALRNTTGATDGAIAATTAYLDKLELLVGVDNNQLIPSLQILTTATRDVAQAQSLQALALDISAGASKDLGAVSLALAKAIGGNVGALTKLGVPLDKNAVKAKDLNAILTSLSETFAGQAEKRAETFEFRMIQLQLAFNQIIDQIGYALIPVLQKFAEYIVDNALPAIQSWVDLNKDKLASALETVTKNVVALGKALFGFVDFISRNQTTIKIFASVIAGLFVASKVYAFATAIALLIPTLTAFTAAAGSAGVAGALLTGGFSAGAAAAALGAFAVTAGALGVSFAASAKNANKAEFAFKGMGNVSMTTGKQMTGLNKVIATNTKFTDYNTNSTKKLTAEEKKAAEMRAAIKKAGLDKFGIKNVSDTDPIQLEAARLNLLKQSNLEEQRKIAAIIENMNAQMKANQAVERYIDLLGVVADQVISDQEVILLASKWGISTDKVVAYTTAIFAVNDAKLSTEEIDLLARQWGITKKQAEMYLDFFKYINDGKLDQSEVNALMDKWGLTNKEVKDYADKISKGVTPSDLWPTPGNQAAQSWRDALAALNAYNAALGVKLSPTGPTVTTPDGGGGGGGGGGGDTFLPVSTALINKAVEDLGGVISVIGANGREFTKLVENTAPVFQTLEDSVAKNAFISQGIVTQPFDAGSFRTAEGGSLFSSGAVGSRDVIVNVYGSVTTENDLVATVRNGLLQGQNNGQAIVKSAVAL
jgi:hypothetical protein